MHGSLRSGWQLCGLCQSIGKGRSWPPLKWHDDLQDIKQTGASDRVKSECVNRKIAEFFIQSNRVTAATDIRPSQALKSGSSPAGAGPLRTSGSAYLSENR